MLVVIETGHIDARLKHEEMKHYAVLNLGDNANANSHYSILTEGFPCFFFSVVRQMPGYNLQRRGMARTLPN